MHEISLLLQPDRFGVLAFSNTLELDIEQIDRKLYFASEKHEIYLWQLYIIF